MPSIGYGHTRQSSSGYVITTSNHHFLRDCWEHLLGMQNVYEQNLQLAIPYTVSIGIVGTFMLMNCAPGSHS